MKKTAVVTGGTEGIGKAIVQKLALDGYQVITCARHKHALITLQKICTTSSHNIKFQVCDLSRKHEVLKFANFIKQAGNVGVLVNNAGVFLGDTIVDEDDNNLSKLIETNLYSAYFLTKALLPLMLAQNYATIVNICSIASFMAYPGGSSYAISKHALLGFSRSLRAEFQDQNIRVTSILPGATYTRSWATSNLPSARFMPAEDIAQVVSMVCKLSPRTVIEDIIMRPQLGDI